MWERTRKFNKTIRGRAILDKILELNKSGDISAMPNNYCCTVVINSCAYSEDDELEKQVALRIAIKSYCRPGLLLVVGGCNLHNAVTH